MTTVYYNPACSKCRRVREILDERGESYEIVEYLKRPPERADLEAIVSALDGEPSVLVRRDKRFADLDLVEADYGTAEEVIGLLLEHPELLERPVVLRDGRAVVARPPDLVIDLLDGASARKRSGLRPSRDS